MIKKIWYLAGFCILLLCNCNAFKKIGSDLGEGLNSKAKPIGKNLVAGLDEGLAESALRAELYKTIDSAITIAGSSANKNLKIVLDSLLSRRLLTFVQQLVENATGKQTRQNIDNLREAAVGAKTKADLQALIQAVLNDENSGKLVNLKNKLLGDETKQQIGNIVDTAMQHLTTRFQSGITDSTLNKLSRFLNNDLKKGIDTNLSVIQKYATWFLVGLAAVAAVIITLVWRNRQKYLKLTALLASHVNAIPDQHVYDQLTARIKQSAVTAGVEPALRSVLSTNELLTTGSWKPIE
jgi:hypothetical protein